MTLFGKFWDRIAPLAGMNRRAAGPATQLDHHFRSEIQDDDPGLAIAIVKAGAIVHAAAYGAANVRTGSPNTSATIFHLASCGKQFTALGILDPRRAG